MSFYSMSGSIGNVVASQAEIENRFPPAELRLQRFILSMRRSDGTANEGGSATSQLDLLFFLTPLSVASYGRQQLGVPS